MRPGSRDHPARILICGDELRELKRHTYLMCEAYGLDRKVERYAGTRPMMFYRWDLDCLLDVIDVVLQDENDYPNQSAPEYRALKGLRERLAKALASLD